MHRFWLARSLLSLGVCAACSQSPTLSRVADGGPGGARDGAGSFGDGFRLPEAGAAIDGPTVELDCELAAKQRGNAGCHFYPVLMSQAPELSGACFAMFVVNPGTKPAFLKLERGGMSLPLGKAARLPQGGGLDLGYVPLADDGTVPPGEVALVFLAQSDSQGFARCPSVVVPAVTGLAHFQLGFEKNGDSGIGDAFHLSSDRPVIAYQVFPYGGGSSALTSATLLLPREAWGRSYLAVHPVQNDDHPLTAAPRTIAIVAAEDDTEVSLRPTANIAAAPGVPAIARGALGTVRLRAGQYLEVVRRTQELTGSVVSANKPVGVFGGAACLQIPADVCCCDTAQQQIPPIEALGSEYTAVRHRSRAPGKEEETPWRIAGVVEGTRLTYVPAAPAGAPAVIGRGQFVEFSTSNPFVVRSQDSEHPFYLAGYMTGGDPFEGAGDPDFVNVLPVSQFLSSYVFFTDPTYPETNLVVVRKKGGDGKFGDVSLECAGAPLTGWKAVGDHEYTRVDLVTGRWEPGIPGCNNGRQRITSAAPFGVTVWGWGTKATGSANASGLPPTRPNPPWYTRYASYAYPAGASIGRVNKVEIIP